MTFNLSRKLSFQSSTFCLLVIFILPLVAYLPAIALHLSLNPMNFGSGLTETRRGVILGGPWLDPNTSFTVQALGGLSADDWLHGRVPWWNPYTGVGLPLAAEMQSLSLFLPFVLLLKLPIGVILLKISLQIVAGLGTFALLRRLQLGGSAALCGAVLFEFNGPFAWFAHAPMTPIAFLPFLLLGIECARESAARLSRGGWALIAGALAYSLYAGFPETAFLDGTLAAAWTLCRFASLSGRARLAFAAKVFMGGAAGLLLASPIIVPFLEYQHLSDISHVFPTDGLPKVSLAPLFMPYILGPLGAFNDADSTHRLANFWGANGGYLNLTVLFLAGIGALSGKRDRPLRILLAMWLLVWIGRLMNFMHLGYLISLVPLMNIVAVDRYCEPAWAMAGAVLAGYALDDWLRGENRRLLPVLVSGAVTLLLGGVALQLALGLIHTLFAASSLAPRYPLWCVSSVISFLAFTLGIGALYLGRQGKRASRAMSVLIIANAVCLYSIPTLAGVRASGTDRGLISFLKQNQALSRFYTLGPFSPNYPAYFRVASINHNAVPIPRLWIQYVKSKLDPPIDSSLFIGYAPGPFTDREKALRERLTAFETTGVKYVVTQRGINPFLDNDAVSVTGKARPTPWPAGRVISGDLPKEFTREGFLRGVSIDIGIYGSSPGGRVIAQMCDAGDCASGYSPLLKARDRESFTIAFTGPPLHVSAGDKLKYTLTYFPDDMSHEEAGFLFLWECRPGMPFRNGPAGQIGPMPQMALTYERNLNPPPLVYQGKVGDVYRLPEPAAYFSTTGGPCKITPLTRESARATCSRPAHLLRRELFYPGWRADVNGHGWLPVEANSIFQTVSLPAGDSDVRFSYLPSNAGWIWSAFAFGIACLLADKAIWHRISKLPGLGRELARRAPSRATS